MITTILGEIQILPYTFVPVGWLACEGQLISISSNEALFTLLGTIYGGDGITTFGLPDLRGRTAVHAGTMTGGPTIQMGQPGGSNQVTLTQAQMPAHTHTVQLTATAGAVNISAGAVTAAATASSPTAGAVFAESTVAQGRSTVPRSLYANGSANVHLNASASVAGLNPAQLISGSAGASQPIDTAPPYLGLRYFIAISGIYPVRN